MSALTTRNEFIRKSVRLLMAGILALIAALLGSRIVFDRDCSLCLVNGICREKTDCDKYRNRNKLRRSRTE